MFFSVIVAKFFVGPTEAFLENQLGSQSVNTCIKIVVPWFEITSAKPIDSHGVKAPRKMHYMDWKMNLFKSSINRILDTENNSSKKI